MAEQNGATVAQLKQNIDSGETRQKVDYPDPGLSPLGTDDEAAGHPADPAVVAATLNQERAIGQRAKAVKAEARPERAWFIPALVTLVLIAAVIGGFLLLR